MKSYRLGSFDVLEKIGEGGMGDVFRGEHRAQDVPVAIKVLRPWGGDDHHFRALFRREVRAVAQLDHPGIITVFDIGEITDATSQASGGALQPNSPYLVMEYQEAGSLDAVDYPLPWPEVRPILLAVLDGLAHAHARGITHLDLKPGNILRADKPAGFPIRLTDFGMAFSQREDLPEVADGGTPVYMAPEQFLGEWRDFGPGTDLYALGCVAFHLGSGRLPFEADNAMRLGAAHIDEAPPVPECPPDYPSGFGDWVLRLLAKRPDERYRSCAAAAGALLALPASGRAAGSAGPGAETRRPPESATVAERAWRPPPPPRRPFKLVGAGLRLFGLRTVPMVGREAEQALLWETLRQVAEHATCGVVVMEGAAGVGKSRLAQWLGERVRELDLADVLIAENRRSRGRESALGHMLARAWSCLDLAAEPLRRRVTARLEAAGVDSSSLHNAVTEFMAPASLGRDYSPGVFHSFPSRSARLDTLVTVLREVYAPRPVVIWLDDAHWNAGALRFLQQAIRRARTEPIPMMVVVTIRDDLVAPSSMVERTLRDLRLQDEVSSLTLSPLSAPETRQLVRGLLYLEGDLAEQVASRSGGNPLYATQLVGDWVTRGILQSGRSGFVLSAVSPPTIPDDVHAVWAQRLERVLDESSAVRSGSSTGSAERMQLQIGLELAAALGGEIDMTEWRAVCTMVGVPEPASVLEHLLGARMVRVRSDRWSFSHSMLGDALERIARERERWPGHNRLCADMLQQRRPIPHWGDSERIGRYRFEAGQYQEALDPLRRGARECMRVEEYPAALELLSLHDRALAELDTPAGDAWRREGWLLQAEIRCLRDELGTAEDLANRVIAGGNGPEAPRFRGAARLVLARVYQRQGRPDAALRAFEDAQATLRAAGLRPLLGACRAEQAQALLETDRLTPAWEAVREAQAIFEETGQLVDWTESQLGLARVIARLGDDEYAAAVCRRVRGWARGEGQLRIEAEACDVLADVHVTNGRPAAAAPYLDQSVQLFERLGFIRNAARSRLSRVLVSLESGWWDEAEAEADQLVGVPEINASQISRLLLSCIRLALAMERSPAAFDESLDHTATLLAEVERPTAEVARCLRVAVERVAGTGSSQRGARVATLLETVTTALQRGPAEAAAS